MKKIKVDKDTYSEMYKLLYLLYGIMLAMFFMDIAVYYSIAVFVLYVVFFLVFIQIPGEDYSK